MPLPLFQVDAFTDSPLAGNPAAVVLLDTGAGTDEAWMQAVAAEMNLSETAFVRPQDRDAGRYELRWFTPTVEVDLCGHATLASAHVLSETGELPPGGCAAFATRSGELRVRRAEHRLLAMDLPADPVSAWAPDPEVVAAIGCEPVGGFRGRGMPVVELADEASVRAVAPDFARLAATEPGSAVVTARASTSGFDFVSRCFAPGYGIDEDPVTGSAHCALGPLWAERLGLTELRALQVSARGGTLVVRVDSTDRVVVAGHAVTVLRGNLTT